MTISNNELKKRLGDMFEIVVRDDPYAVRINAMSSKMVNLLEEIILPLRDDDEIPFPRWKGTIHSYKVQFHVMITYDIHELHPNDNDWLVPDWYTTEPVYLKHLLAHCTLFIGDTLITMTLANQFEDRVQLKYQSMNVARRLMPSAETCLDLVYYPSDDGGHFVYRSLHKPDIPLPNDIFQRNGIREPDMLNPTRPIYDNDRDRLVILSEISTLYSHAI